MEQLPFVCCKYSVVSDCGDFHLERFKKGCCDIPALTIKVILKNETLILFESLLHRFSSFFFFFLSHVVVMHLNTDCHPPGNKDDDTVTI